MHPQIQSKYERKFIMKLRTAAFLLPLCATACQGRQQAMVDSCRKAFEDWKPYYVGFPPVRTTQESRRMERKEYAAFLMDGRSSADYVNRMLADYDAGKADPTRFTVRLDYQPEPGQPFDATTVQCSYGSFLDRWPDPAPGALAIHELDAPRLAEANG